MPAIGSSSTPRFPLQKTRAHSALNGRVAKPVTVVETISSVATPRERAINSIKALLSEHFPDAEGMADIIQSRAERLYEIEHDPVAAADTKRSEAHIDNEIERITDAVRNVIKKGKHRDGITATASGGLKAAPFSFSSLPAEKLAEIACNFFNMESGSLSSEIVGGVFGGAIAMSLRSATDKIFENAQDRPYWFAAEEGKLEPAMQEVFRSRKGFMENWKFALFEGSGFSARNVVTGIAHVATNSLSEERRLKAATGSNSTFSILGGGLGHVLGNRFSKLYGPQYMFGRTDWEDCYRELKASTIPGHVLWNGGHRFASAVLGAISPRHLTKGFANIFSVNMLAEIGVLAAGIGFGVNLPLFNLRQAMQSGISSSATLTTPQRALEQLTNVALAGTIYASQGTTGAVFGRYVKPYFPDYDKGIDKFFDASKLLKYNLPAMSTGRLRGLTPQLEQQIGTLRNTLDDTLRNAFDMRGMGHHSEESLSDSSQPAPFGQNNVQSSTVKSAPQQHAATYAELHGERYIRSIPEAGESSESSRPESPGRSVRESITSQLSESWQSAVSHLSGFRSSIAPVRTPSVPSERSSIRSAAEETLPQPEVAYHPTGLSLTRYSSAENSSNSWAGEQFRRKLETDIEDMMPMPGAFPKD